MLASFPEDCRTILLLYYGEQFTTREIAEILGMKENTVKSRLRRSRESLRETMVYSL
jgi:RNA polymerase sigma-70 factor (ECF subfamily)